MVGSKAFPAGLIRALLRMLAAIGLALALPAQAHEPGADALTPACHAYAKSEAGADALRKGGPGWICTASDWNTYSRHALLRFDLGPDGRVPSQFSSRLARFESLRIDIEHPGGSVSTYRISTNEIFPRGHMLQVANIPEAGQPARRVTVELVGPTFTGLISEARLHHHELALIGPEQVWIALLCGLLLVPLFFNLALYRVLRDRFLLWHVVVVGFMLTHTFLTSGLVPLLGAVPIGAVSMSIAMTFCGGAASALMMASYFIERDRMDPPYRRALRLAALWLVLNAAFYAATVDWLQGWCLDIYFANWAVAMAVLAVSIGNATLRGGRAVKFLLASWVPLMITGIWQIISSVSGDHAEPMSLFIAQRFAIAAEVLITSMGIADRFIQLRRDRDDHRVLASELTRLAERDPLTGLFNRRAVEGRFATLRADGFATMALLDLDHFKSINDEFGHMTGDQVLRTVAASLPEDRDVLSIRMGGEEFMLLLRGKRAAQRAEQVRRAITARVARDVDGLDRPVTASMGLVEIPAAVMPDATFAAIYARADGLLYQAKRAGRNRTVSERMTVFANHHQRQKPTAA
jgi:diguanylate cyclase (GGDEF)-like protein